MSYVISSCVRPCVCNKRDLWRNGWNDRADCWYISRNFGKGGPIAEGVNAGGGLRKFWKIRCDFPAIWYIFWGSEWPRILFGCLLYADDILLVPHSLHDMQAMLDLCAKEAAGLDFTFDTKKSVVLRIGPRYNYACVPLTLNGAVGYSHMLITSSTWALF